MPRKIILVVVAAILGVAVLGWLVYESSKPLPGQKIAYDCSSFVDFSKLGTSNGDDKCRVHVPEGTIVNYSTNPPVFGPHYADWVKAGVYSETKDDRNLIHALEHGYVIMWYKCPSALAPKAGTTSIEADLSTMAPLSIEDSASASANLSSDCKTRRDQLADIYNKKGKHKLIVAPRSNLETNFALTTWGYLDKFDNFDEKRIDSFIDAHLDNGPEKTME